MEDAGSISNEGLILFQGLKEIILWLIETVIHAEIHVNIIPGTTQKEVLIQISVRSDFTLQAFVDWMSLELNHFFDALQLGTRKELSLRINDALGKTTTIYTLLTDSDERTLDLVSISEQKIRESSSDGQVNTIETLIQADDHEITCIFLQKWLVELDYAQGDACLTLNGYEVLHRWRSRYPNLKSYLERTPLTERVESANEEEFCTSTSVVASIRVCSGEYSWINLHLFLLGVPILGFGGVILDILDFGKKMIPLNELKALGLPSSQFVDNIRGSFSVMGELKNDNFSSTEVEIDLFINLVSLQSVDVENAMKSTLNLLKMLCDTSIIKSEDLVHIESISKSISDIIKRSRTDSFKDQCISLLNSRFGDKGLNLGLEAKLIELLKIKVATGQKKSSRARKRRPVRRNLVVDLDNSQGLLQREE